MWEQLPVIILDVKDSEKNVPEEVPAHGRQTMGILSFFRDIHTNQPDILYTIMI